jgi:hypothetical protein
MVDLSCNGGGQSCPILGFTCTGQFVANGSYPSDTHYSCINGKGADVEFDDVIPPPNPARDRGSRGSQAAAARATRPPA